MLTENIILSYPRSGNHLVRFFIELLSEKPTFGCKKFKKTDLEIYKNIFPEKIPFNISDFDKKDCYIKYHEPPLENICINKLIFIVRNPKEVLLRHNDMKIEISSYENYFKNIDFYNNHKGKKLLLYYEDILTNKINFINILYEFLDLSNIEKKNYVFSNIEKLYDLSSKGIFRSWDGINSNSIHYYYKKIPISIKTDFDNYLNEKFIKYSFLNEKYNIKEEESNLKLLKSKIIFIYWAQKFVNAPDIVKKCLLSWKLKNPNWTIIELDDDNIYNYINLEKEIPDIQNKIITKTSYSDIIRIFCLEKYGGVWCDATTFCNIPLDNWLDKNTSTGFFAFAKSNKFLKYKKLCSSWFLYSNTNNYIIKEWKKAVIKYWNSHDKMCTYSWIFELFYDLYTKDTEFKLNWDMVNKIPCGDTIRVNNPINNDTPHHFVPYDKKLFEETSEKNINDLNNHTTPLYKLTYKFDNNKYNNNCLLYYLLNNKLHFNLIHIGKTGGSTISKYLTNNNIQYNKIHCKQIDYEKDKNYIITLRNPISRFISAFNWRYKKFLNNEIIKNRFNEYKIIFELSIYEKYQNINNLAEKLYINNKLNEELHLELRTIKSHLFMNIDFYISNFLEQCPKDKIYKVITNENLNKDMKSLFNIDITDREKDNKNFDKIKRLSKQGYLNLKKYLEKDYKCINKLIDYNLVDKNYLEDGYGCLDLSFMHIPKTGGTSIEDAAKNNNLNWGRFDKNFESLGACAWHSPQKVKNYCFCVIRDPFYKIISQFYHENEVENYNKDELNKFIELKFDIIKNNINHLGNHYLHQIEFFKYCDIAISFDNLQNNLNELMKLFELHYLTLDNKPGGNLQQAKRNNKNFKRLNYDDINEKNREKIRNFYIEDINLYKKVKKKGIFIKSDNIENLINNNYLIISFCSYDYVKLAEIWVQKLVNLNITNYLIISTDKKTYNHFISKNINTELRNYNKKETFWVYRIKILKNFFEKNKYDYLIHSDLDAVWEKNICEELFNENDNIDLFFSQGTIFPKEHLEKHKFVLCCGFFCIKYNKKTLNFFKNYFKILEIIKDDQKAINIELINTKWNISNEKYKSLPDKKYIYYDNDVNGYNSDYDLNLLLISFNKIQREFLDKNGYIYHILKSKKIL